jgi:hypothetical protein
MSITTMQPETTFSLLNFIERASRDPDIDVGKLQALLEMQRSVMHEQAKRAFNSAMAEAQSEMEPVLRDATNSHIGNKYAKLETIDAQMRPVYTHHGFSVRYGSAPPPHEGWIRITCTVAHRDGYYEEHYLDSQLDVSGSGGRTNKTPVQGVGSSVTYLRRYLLCMVFNIVLANEDDDGEATRRTAAPSRPAPQPESAKRMTVGAWLDNLELHLAAAQTSEDVDAIVGGSEVVAARQKLRNGAQERLEALITGAYERLQAAADDAAKAAVEDESEMALPE